MDAITPAQKVQLLELLGEHGLEELSPRLIALARPCIALAATSRDNGQTVGNSRLGGVPDVPRHFDWPEGQSFLMQLNLEQIGPLDQTGRLPITGMLYFFLGDDEGHDDLPHQVIWTDAAVSDLRAGEAPPGYTDVTSPAYTGGDTSVTYTGFNLGFKRSISLPHYGSRQYRLLADELEKGGRTEAYFAVQEALKMPRASRRVGQHQILGYCSCIDEDADVIACFSRHGLDPGLYRFDKAELERMVAELETEAGGQNYPAARPDNYRQHLLQTRRGQLNAAMTQASRVEDARKSVEDWLTLLDLDSDLDSGMCFWDAGRIHFMIHKADLTRRHFSGTYASLIST